jgi:N-acetylglutamate synthase-like GNAT family acetyltransferase
MSLETKKFLAKVNMITGTAKTFIDEKGEMFGCGGIHYVGVGEAWCISRPDTRLDKKLTLLREAKKFFKEQRDSLNLWRIYAANYISQTYLEHLGFEKADNISIWTKTE